LDETPRSCPRPTGSAPRYGPICTTPRRATPKRRPDPRRHAHRLAATAGSHPAESL